MPELSIVGILGAAFGAYIAGKALKVVWRRVFRPKAKGRIGESKVNRVLKRFTRKGARGRNDVLLQKEHGTSQIDHLLVTKQGIISLETKNYSGVISGSADSHLWTQSFPGTRTEPRQFYNPIRQNKGHIKALKEILGEHSNVPFHSLVVFSGDCDFPHLPGVVDVAHLKGALRMITTGPAVLSEKEMSEIEKIIDRNSISSRAEREEHNSRAGLKATASSAEVQALVQESIENSVYVSTYVPEPTVTPEQNNRRLLTDIQAKLTIRNRTDTIDGFFEAAKRCNNGEKPPIGGAFDYFICPYTGDKFPASEALSFYQGLWIAYLNKHPDLVSFMKEVGPGTCGNSFRCKKVLNQYCKDGDTFVAQTRQSAWYRNMVAKQQNRKKPIDRQIQSASSRANPARTSSGTKNPEIQPHH